MVLMVSVSKRVFISFLGFGLLNNILYVVILSAAVDIVGYSIPKAVVLLADIMPSLSIKLLAPFFIHKLPYETRIWVLVFFSFFGMLLVSFSKMDSTVAKILGISMASLSSGMGEVSFLQLTHYYDEKKSIGGFSMGTGGAGILGSFFFLLMTNIIGMSSQVALTSFAVVPFGFPIIFFFLLPKNDANMMYESLDQENLLQLSTEMVIQQENQILALSSQHVKTNWARFKQHFNNTVNLIIPLLKPYMIPLCSVYFAEYTINQGVAPTILFPLKDLPKWLFKHYRDIYVVYGFVYQLGVFISRSSLTFGFQFQNLYVLSLLQLLNLGIAVYQSLYDFPFSNIFPVIILIFYEGLLGGLLYVNTFMSVSQKVNPNLREFSMACVGMSDSFGIMVAGFLNVWLEKSLCDKQVSRGKDWCKFGSSATNA